MGIIEERVRELHAELDAVGLPVFSVQVSETGANADFTRPLSTEEQNLARLVRDANQKLAGSAEITALRDSLGADARWDEYVSTRKEEIDKRRRERYQYYADLLLDRLIDSFQVRDFNGHKVLTVDPTELQRLQQIRQAIKADLPYAVE